MINPIVVFTVLLGRDVLMTEEKHSETDNSERKSTRKDILNYEGERNVYLSTQIS